MNYDHAFHAGNFADVFKHIVFARIVAHLREKPAAFRIIDTHAGAGVHDLASEAAQRTGEWRDGIRRLMEGARPAALDALIAPYLEAIARLNPHGGLRLYPGSPALALALMRPQDRLIACEREPRAAAALARMLRRDARAKAVAIDGWTALGAYVPPKERRGLVLIDPPFEQPDEFARLADTVAKAYRKWPTGLYMLWYPIKDAHAGDALWQALEAGGIARRLCAEIMLGATAGETRLTSTGIVVINPPWTLADQLDVILPPLMRLLDASGRGRHRVLQAG